MLKLLTKQGYSINVPKSVNNSSTYVLLEKEEWFERELPFLMRWLRPGMRIIDIGANIGIYTLAGAKAVGASGHVYSVEPGVRPRKYLEASCREMNCGNVTIIQDAVSDIDGSGLLSGDDSELASLVDGPGRYSEVEQVSVATLDTLARKYGWDSIDFLKIDVEGAEYKVVSGGKEFLEKNSPLVMFEVPRNGIVDSKARNALEELGYRIFRILGNGEYLVPAPPCEELPELDLNLFAVKGDRLRQLERDGFLANTEHEVDAADLLDSLELDRWLDRPFARSLDIARSDILGSPQEKTVLNFLVSTNRTAPVSVRYGALLFAWSTSKNVLIQAPSASHYLTHSRLAWELGYVNETVNANQAFCRSSPSGEISGLFIPPIGRFDEIPIEDGNEEAWFAAALGNQLLDSIAHSTAFLSAELAPLLLRLCDSRYATPEMARALVLMYGRKGKLGELPDRPWQLASRCLNPSVWNRSGWEAT